MDDSTEHGVSETVEAPTPIPHVEGDGEYVLEKIFNGEGNESEALKGPRHRRVRMTPERAEKLFKERNTRNRPFTQSWGEYLKNEILAGNWRYNAEAIKISKSGVLLDGQHRLWAISNSGKTCEILVVEGLEDDVFSTMDQGKRRSGGDVLAIRGVKRHNVVSGAISMLYRLVKDNPIGKGANIPAYGIETIWERHPGIVNAVEACIPVFARGGEPIIGLAYVAAYRYLLDPIMFAPEKATSMVEGLAVGANLQEDDPLFRFRQRVSDTRKRSAMMTGSAKLALLTKAIGMHMAGEKVGRALNQPEASETFSSMIPGMEEGLELLSPELRLADLDY